ncbi:putative Two pore domain potassium channel [Rosa chinensis]|uniref:Putative Two pore domain potassium channel n=1 Tax=Rosa chinensis TaxID=74649 RepID=A0A2P6QUN8_ROSCH|nr:putative Two pore domain potassium channel [Rosa chinensis]
MTGDKDFLARKKKKKTVSDAPGMKKAPLLKKLLNKSGSLWKLFNKSGSNPAENETDQLGSNEGRAFNNEVRIGINEPEVMPHRNAVREDGGCMDQKVNNGAPVQDMVIFSGGVHHQRQQQIENSGADHVVIHIEEGVVVWVIVPNIIPRLNLGAANLERAYSLLSVGGIITPFHNFMNFWQGNGQGLRQQLYNLILRQQQNYNIGAQGDNDFHQQLVLDIKEAEGGVVGGGRRIPRIRVAGGARRIPRMIHVRLSGGDVPVHSTYAWLCEKGQSIPFNASVHSAYGYGQQSIWFEEGGLPPAVKPFAPDTADFLTKSSPYFCQGLISLVVFFLVSSLPYFFLKGSGEIIGPKNDSNADPFYFSMVIMSSTGYGDMYPKSTRARLLTCFWILFGVGIVAGRLSTVFNCLANAFGNLFFGYMIRRSSGQLITERSRAKYKVWFAVLVVALCIVVGLFGCKYLEGMDWLESFYLSVVTVSSVGFGDLHFNSLAGKVFATFWIPVSTILVGISFGYISKCGYGSLR